MDTEQTHRTGTRRRILIDCTTTFAHDRNTGIQRVVRNIANTAPGIGAEMGLECRPVVFTKSAGCQLIASLPVSAADSGPAAASVSTWKNRLAGWKHRLRDRLRRSILALGLYKPAYRLVRLLESGARLGLRPLRLLRHRGLQFDEGDVLLLAEIAFQDHFPRQMHEAKRRGALVGVIVYDLLPLRYQEFFTEYGTQMFREWWEKVVGVADFFVYISDATGRDVQAYLQEQPAADAGTCRAIPGRTFRLGAELDGSLDETNVRERFPRMFADSSDENVYLMVSTIERHKNHQVVLDAFDELWARDVPVKLLLFGKHGTNVGHITKRIYGHPQFNRRLFWIEDGRDAELEFCFRRASALITASHNEGFNLPIVEALSRGCPVLASDIPVHHEVGGRFAAYFPTRDSAALARLVQEHQQAGRQLAADHPRNFHWPDWSESCRELLERVSELSSECDRGEMQTNRERAA